jgi:voltage-gated potassium channel
MKSKMADKLRKIIFDADTRAGKIYDILLIATISLSVLLVMLDSVASINAIHGKTLYKIEWLLTIIFTIDYVIRLICVKRPSKYAKSFFGVVDLLGVIPTYLSLIFPGSHYLVAIRFLRILRVFRVLKLVAYAEEVHLLLKSLRESMRKIAVFLFVVLVLVVVLGSLMYVVEGVDNGFTSIPKSIYWAIVTLTTVGYGDISPNTPLGQTIAAAIMILGYSMIVIPTGIVTVDMARGPLKTQKCNNCKNINNDSDAIFCKYCGVNIEG